MTSVSGPKENRMQFVYPANLSRTAPGEVLVNFRDLPECVTSGSDTSDALTAAGRRAGGGAGGAHR